MRTIASSAGAQAFAAASAMRQPCLPGQRRTWVLDRMAPGNPALNIAARWRIEGRLSGVDLDHAFARILARHPALRTAIAEEDGAPVQAVEPLVSLDIADVDLTALAEVDAIAEADRIAQLEARAPFDLAVAPLLRVTRLRVREDVSILLVTTHRVVCDASSIGVFARELATLCAAPGQGRLAESLPPGGADPADATRPPPAETLRRDEDFWRRSLQSLRPFELRPDRARPPAQTPNGAIVSRPLERDLIAGLQDVSRRHDCSLFVTALATLCTLLHRYSGEHDIAVGTPASGDGAEWPGGAARLVNTIVVRADVSGDPSFAEVLARVRDAAVAGFKHPSTPLDRVIEMLAPERDLSRPALFAIHFVLQGAAFAEARGGAVRLVDLPPCSAGALYDLSFVIAERDGWLVSCEYNTDLFESQTVAGLLDHFANLLRAVAADATQRIATMPMLDAAERHALAVDCNRTEAPYPLHLTVPRLFEDQVRRTPRAVAVVCGEHSLSYRELERAANRLAHALQARGVGRSSRVGVCLDRSPDLVVALLAVLKTGAAYLPLDPAYPAARLAQIVGDARPAAILTQRALRERLPQSGALLVLLDAEAAAIGRQRDSPPVSTALPGDPAYVIYTSGSTGRPKGVQILHQALINLLWAMRDRPGITARDTLIAVTTVSFDIAALELFLPLIVGAKLVVAQDGDAGDGAALLKLLRRHRATMLQATPVTWQILLAAGWRGDPRLKMLCGGEALPRALADRLLAQGGELWNLYGPTETAIWSSAVRVAPGAGPVPIGPPIANTQFYVLDAAAQLVPAGVPGELYIGGDGVASGYVNLPEITRERFVADRYRPHAGARLYRTGDRVRRRPQGGFEFLGRGDGQVKVRGFRIELGEIESVIRAHPQVADCVAVAAPDASGEVAIRAYVVARAATAVGAGVVESLRASLRQALPAYMCPGVIALLAALPRTPNGKIDRAALPAVAPVAPAPAARAATAVERRLALLWSAVLGIPDVAVDANFFEIGGHSLLAVRLLARIETAFGRTLSLAALFSHPTIAGQARLLEHGDARAFDFRQVVRLQRNGAGPPLIAINNTGIYYALSRRLGPDQPFTSLQLFDPSLPRAALPRTLPDIAAEYAQLIRRVQRSGPYALLGWCVAGTLAFEVARQLCVSGQRVSRLILFDTLAPGHLQRLPWPRSVLADYAYRWKLIAADWARAKQDKRRVASFLANRTVVMKLRELLRPGPNRTLAPAANANGESPEPAAPLGAEQYDQWLLRYLESAAAAYQPRPYPGSMTLFRSSQEPAGRFLDPQMGWGEFVEGGMEVVVIDGDHFSIFQEPGVSRMAQHIAAAPSP